MNLGLRVGDHRPDNAGHAFGQLDMCHGYLPPLVREIPRCPGQFEGEGVAFDASRRA